MSDSGNSSIAVIGCGSWGTALAVLLARNGHSVSLWGRDVIQMQEIESCRRNIKYLPDLEIPKNVRITADIQAAVTNAAEILLVVPSAAISKIIQQIKPCINATTRIAIASKGFEPDHLQLLHEVVEKQLSSGNSTCVISGPTFAAEVAKGLPTAITVASNNETHALEFASFLSNDLFRAYTSTDVIGVEVGGAVKNVMAIAAGISDGLGFGSNSRAALITRGLAEITRLGMVLGGQMETFMGLTGLGDLVLTCTDNQSRTRRVGLALAQGKSVETILKELGQVAEGVYTTQKVVQLARSLKVEMPIAEEVYAVIYENKPPIQAVQTLFSRGIKAEN